MKTNKFENTIRRKLESIEPDFQEHDWARMQQYMHTHNPPSFLQQYGSWIGYAAAASVTTVMAFMYTNQLSQNDHLINDVKSLQSQIEVIKNLSAPASKPDTIYVLQKATETEQYSYTQRNAERSELKQELFSEAPEQREEHSQNTVAQTADVNNETPSITPEETIAIAANAPKQPAETSSVTSGALPPVNAAGSSSGTSAGNAGMKTFDSGFNVANIAAQVQMNSGSTLSRRMHYELANRVSGRQVQRALLAYAPAVPATNVNSTKKAQQTAQAENVIPKLNLKVPYRFGGGVQVESGGQGKTILGEVIVNKKFSLSAGITWLKVKPMEFFTEKMFREKNRRDFKTSHPGEIPMIFQLYNIKVSPSVVQIPLTLAFRNTLKKDWAYYASMGTNIKVSAKEEISYDCRTPNNEFFNETFTIKKDTPPVTSMNFSLGVEKMWYPIVVQAEGYLVTYFKPLTPLSHSAGPGVRVKLLYQIGRQL
jgi:hypothetical protein